VHILLYRMGCGGNPARPRRYGPAPRAHKNINKKLMFRVHETATGVKNATRKQQHHLRCSPLLREMPEQTERAKRETTFRHKLHIARAR